MRSNDLNKIKKLYFTSKDVAETLGISNNSAEVTCSRYVKSGILLRLKKNFYMLRQRWEKISEEETYIAANLLQVPSYVSLTTALAFYNITTQVQRDFYESISIKRTKEIILDDKTFMFTKIDKHLYNNFIRQDGYFIATPEKALLDAVYLTSLKRYNLDFEALDLTKTSRVKIKELIKNYPVRVTAMWREHVGSV
jgi:predicted transcriptional regulator of viral defense system